MSAPLGIDQAAVDAENALFQQQQMEYLKSRVAYLASENARLVAELQDTQARLAHHEGERQQPAGDE